MNVFCLLSVACWLCAATLLGWTARASQMSFLGWFLIGVFFPVILLALAAEYARERLHALLILDPKLASSRPLLPRSGLPQSGQAQPVLRT